jgi:hypothetical protein
MTDPRWFRLVIRAIGVLTLVLAIPHVGGAISSISTLIGEGPGGYRYMMANRTGLVGGESWWNPYTFAVAATAVAALAQAALGLYLLRGAPRLVAFCTRQARGHCPACDYDIRGLKGQCPECGLAIPEAAAPPSA